MHPIQTAEVDQVINQMQKSISIELAIGCKKGMIAYAYLLVSGRGPGLPWCGFGQRRLHDTRSDQGLRTFQWRYNNPIRVVGQPGPKRKKPGSTDIL